MKHTLELDKALSELKKITGISLDVHAENAEEEELALEQIRSLSLAYKEKFNKSFFLHSLMTENRPIHDISKRASQLHIEHELPRVLLLVETKTMLDDTVMQVLKNLFPSQSKTHLVSMSEKSVVLLHPIKASENEQDMSHLARMIVDTLNMEALTPVHVAYSQTADTLAGLSNAFRETCLALSVGKLFCAGQTVFSSRRLGVGGLIYQLPLDVCTNFLREVFGSDIPKSFDEETTIAINTFFHNNLNIAETSRQLHMHRNTLIYRLEQIEKRTGLDIRKFEDAMTFKIATMVLSHLHAERDF
ncbi:MAG: helix-turn-helix domain-containing protein [Muricomes sp.]